VKGRDDDIQGRRGASPPRPAEVRSLELRRLQTLVEAEIAAALSLHASDYQLITPNGEPVSRDECLGMIGRREFVYDVFQPASDIAVRAYGEVVAVRYRARIEVHWNGGNDRGCSGTRISTSGALGAGRQCGLRRRGSRSGPSLGRRPAHKPECTVPKHEFLRPANRDPPLHHSRNGCRPGRHQLGYGRNGR
jgi:hypothetical protein